MVVKSLFKIILMVIVLFALGTYAKVLLDDDISTTSGLSLALPDINLSGLTEKIATPFVIKEKNKNAYLYKWRDKKGVIYYTSEKPPENVTNYETINISTETNVVPAVPVTDKDREAVKSQPSQIPSTELPDNVYSVDGVKHVLDQAKNIQTLVDDQFNQTEAIKNQD